MTDTTPDSFIVVRTVAIFGFLSMFLSTNLLIFIGMVCAVIWALEINANRKLKKTSSSTTAQSFYSTDIY